MRDLAILRFIAAFQSAHFYSPSMREMQDALAHQYPFPSLSVIDYNLKKLQHKGLLCWPTFAGRTPAQRVPRALIITAAGYAVLAGAEVRVEGAPGGRN